MIQNMTDSQAKKILSMKLCENKQNKKKRRKHNDNFNGMTEEEMIAEQKKLFEKAQNYVASDQEEDGQMEDLAAQNDQYQTQNYQYPSYPDQSGQF